MPALSLARTLPIKKPPGYRKYPQPHQTGKKEKHGSVYLICNRKGDVLIRKRMEKGLLSGLYEFPWRDEGNYPELNNAVDTGREVIHVFTHFKLTLRIYRVQREQPFADGFFTTFSDLGSYPFSTLMKKVLKQAENIIRS